MGQCREMMQRHNWDIEVFMVFEVFDINSMCTYTVITFNYLKLALQMHLPSTNE